ncbi:MAG: SpoIID/LytB domain-containing protein [Cyanobacteria bacterium RM1_2_2]|nr:SpoIID/LytB domain-containing protein [Cyanobacteria bacterium RM1_2_2]
MTKSQVVQFFKRYPLLLLSLLAALQVAGVLLLVYRRQAAPPPAASAAPAVPLPTTALPTTLLPPSLDPPFPSPLKPAKTATKSSPPPESAAEPASPQPPALTPEQQAVNQQYKQEFVPASSMVDSLIEMRVAIAEGVPALSVGSAAEAAVMDQDRNPLLTLAAGTSYGVQPDGSGLGLNGTQLPSIILIEPANGNLFTLGDRTYRGRLLLVNDGGKIWAVNLVNLRHYLHSVVASEVSPSWKPEALKAQSVAARSYALTYYFKPMSSLFHMGATEYYQVYSGIDREAPETSQAVDATAGEFVSYRGGIVESLYAASDDIVAEAFQGHGMSQLGALNLAEQGYTYHQILANYYPGTGLGRIVQDYE